MEFIYPEGATPLDLDAIRGLVPDLGTQSELNEFEGRNITDGLKWARKSRNLRRDLLTADGLSLLHQRMFEHTWRWAGQYRRTNMNIGVEWPIIGIRLRELCDDVPFWVEHKTYSWDELAIRFHHRLIQIHPWPNGNGRHGRIAANLLLEFNRQPVIDWGRGLSLSNTGAVRSSYIAAMRAADAHDFGPLMEFASGKGASRQNAS